MPRSDLEDELTSSYQITKPQQEHQLPRSYCETISAFLCTLFNIAFFATGFFLLWNFLGRPTNGTDAVNALSSTVQQTWGHFNVSDFTNVLENLTENDWDFGFNEDPFVDDNTTRVWKTNDGNDGLTLTLQNALDESWQNEFYDAVSDWRESEVLTLNTEIVDIDNTCTHVNGVMKVCNGNFGKTGWIGINEAMLEYTSHNDPGFIVASVAKMNEFYLNNANYARRLYTMCHEIGHGFGLPHTDENYNNKNQGNCLDYTHYPESNMHPGDVNFDRLVSMYLSSNSSSSRSYDDDNDDDDYVVVDDDANNYDYAVEGDDGRRYLRRVILRHYLYA